MQSSQTTQNFNEEINKHKLVKHVRSHDITDKEKRRHLTLKTNRSKSSNFRASLRNLTSCALARRKASRSNDYDGNLSLNNESNVPDESDYHQSSKTLLVPSRSSSSSPSHKKSHRYIKSSLQSIDGDIPTVISRRKLSDKKNSIQTALTTSNTSVHNPSIQIQSIGNDDISVAKSRKLSSNELSKSLTNLMNIKSESDPVNNTTQISADAVRHVNSSSSASINRSDLFESTSNMNSTDTVELSTIQRSILNENNHSGSSSPSSFIKSTNEYKWCYENSTSNFDVCSPQLEIDDKPLTYCQEFQSTEHFNWYGTSEIHGPVIISYKFLNNQNKPRYIKAIVRTRQKTSVESLTNLLPLTSSMDILRQLCEQCDIKDIEYFDPILCDGTQDLLRKYDESHVSYKHKFGIIYQCENQSTEEDMFSNETHSNAMDKFLNLLGRRVTLKNFDGFRGGLDVKSDHTGTESIYEKFYNHEIMFHVSTLLPHSKIERQQLERKRHIGNDIVAIVFQENETTFNPECIASQFLHVYLVITKLDKAGTKYKVTTIYRDSVPPFGPVINHSNVYHDDQTFKHWILTKLINAEMASCRAKAFQKYQERTKMNLFDNLYRTLHDNNRSSMHFVLNNSQYKHECDIEQQKEDMQMYSSTKTNDRHTDNSILGSVRRRFIASKLRSQQPATYFISTTTTTTTTTTNGNDLASKIRPPIMDMKQNLSKDIITTNGYNHGKTTSIFSSPKNHNLRMEKSNGNRSLIQTECLDPNFRTNSRVLSSVLCQRTPSNDSTNHEDSSVHSTSSDINKLSLNNIDHENDHFFLLEDLQSLSKDDLIQYIFALQQQYPTRVAQMDPIHSKAIR